MAPQRSAGNASGKYAYRLDDFARRCQFGSLKHNFSLLESSFPFSTDAP
jgi:hypothetical protein